MISLSWDITETFQGIIKKPKVRKYYLFEAKVNAKTISYGVIIQAVNVYLNIVNPSSIHYPR